MTRKFRGTLVGLAIREVPLLVVEFPIFGAPPYWRARPLWPRAVVPCLVVSFPTHGPRPGTHRDGGAVALPT
jgi:hypothetical protein